jgi:hypothetical protein
LGKPQEEPSAGKPPARICEGDAEWLNYSTTTRMPGLSRIVRSDLLLEKERAGMEPFTKALEVVARVMRDGAATHPDNDWIRRSPEYHLGRAEEHLRPLRDDDQLRNHRYLAATELRW